jgi:hypothetical protein
VRSILIFFGSPIMSLEQAHTSELSCVPCRNDDQARQVNRVLSFIGPDYDSYALVNSDALVVKIHISDVSFSQ